MSRAESATREWWALALLSVIVGITAVVRLRLLDLPLDRDEGEYAYIAQLLLDGVPPYAGAYAMKMPGISAVYAIILSVFGKTPAAIHLGVLVASAASTVLVFESGEQVDMSLPAAGSIVRVRPGGEFARPAPGVIVHTECRACSHRALSLASAIAPGRLAQQMPA